MKIIILLGVAILFAGSMVMAAGLDLDTNTTIPGGTYDYIYISNAGDAQVDIAATVTSSGEVEVTDGDGLTGSMNIGFLRTLNVLGDFTMGGGAGASASLNVEGSMSVSGLFTYNGRCESAALGSVSVDISGDLTGDGLIIWGGYDAAYASYDVSVTGAVTSNNTIYVGGVTGGIQGGGQAEVTYYSFSTVSSKKTFIGWHAEGDAKGRLTLVGSSVNYDENELYLNSQGTLRYIADPWGVSRIEVYMATASRAWLEQGSIIELEMSALGTPSIGDTHDLIWCEEFSDLKWQEGEAASGFYAGVQLDSVSYAAGWRLQEIYHQDSGILQAVYTPIPEPITMALLGLGGLLLAIHRKN